LKPKHQQIFDALSRDILNGRYAPGQKFPSEAALVTRFRVSRITVGRAVSDLQERGLVERFAGSGTYVKRPAEAPGKGLLFGLIIPDLGTTEIFEPICQGIANAPNAAGHALLWPQSTGADASREHQALQLCEQCIAREVSGVFFAPLEMTPRATEINRRVVAALRKAGIPTVYLDRRPDDMAARDRCDLVSIDNQRAGFLATDHLLKCGVRRIGFLAYRGQASSVAGRVAGYRQALRHAGDVIYVSADGELPEKAARFDAFVCSNDHIAGHAMLTLLAKGRRVPEDVRIVGIDDVMYASLLPVQLTTIHQPCGEIGNMALQVMLERIAHPKMAARDVLIDCELVVRQSCGCNVKNTD
jgi:GntR family transcriptional regulator, arabinose operon transcriptional repressor